MHARVIISSNLELLAILVMCVSIANHSYWKSIRSTSSRQLDFILFQFIFKEIYYRDDAFN